VRRERSAAGTRDNRRLEQEETEGTERIMNHRGPQATEAERVEAPQINAGGPRFSNLRSAFFGVYLRPTFAFLPLPLLCLRGSNLCGIDLPWPPAVGRENRRLEQEETEGTERKMNHRGPQATEQERLEAPQINAGRRRFPNLRSASFGVYLRPFSSAFLCALCSLRGSNLLRHCRILCSPC